MVPVASLRASVTLTPGAPAGLLNCTASVSLGSCTVSCVTAIAMVLLSSCAAKFSVASATGV